MPSPSVLAHGVPVPLSCAPVQLLQGRTSAGEKGQNKHETNPLQRKELEGGLGEGGVNTYKMWM